MTTSADVQWRDIPGFDGSYQVSSIGSVRSLDRIVRNHTGFRRCPGQLMRIGRYPRSKRPMVVLSKDGRCRPYPLHWLVARAFLGPRPTGMECCHNDGDPLNNRVGNLRWDTRSANVLDSVRHGVHVNASKTHCKRGHEFTVENILWLSEGKRRNCITCRRIRDKESKRRIRAALKKQRWAA